MPNFVGGMPARRGGKGNTVVEWANFPWEEILELAQANPGVPTCHESLQDVVRHSYITEALRNSNFAARGKDHKKGMAPEIIREAMAILGGHFFVSARTTVAHEKKDKAKGNVWIQWDPDRAGE